MCLFIVVSQAYFGVVSSHGQKFSPVFIDVINIHDSSESENIFVFIITGEKH